MDKMIKFFFLSVTIIFSSAYGQNAGPNLDPQRIIMNLTSEPSSSMAVTWRTKEKADNPMVQYAEATDWTQFTSHLKRSIASTERTVLDDDSIVYYYSAIMIGLMPNTSYLYRVGNDLSWSEWCQFSTAANGTAPFEFLFFGDPQNDIKEHVSRIFRGAFAKSPEARFWIFSGDIASEPEDSRWEELFYAAGFIFKNVPAMMVPGNHDNSYLKENSEYLLNEKGKKIRTKVLPPAWRAQFAMPENGIKGLEESSYYFDYQGVRIIMLNSNDRLAEQAQWMDSILGVSPGKWNIVSFHHPLYSVGGDRDERGTRDAFQNIFDKHKVDLVLSGHDHVYARSHRLRQGAKARDGEDGTVYVVSVSGPKMYDLSLRYDSLMEKIGGETQLFQSIKVDGNRLIYRSFTATGKLYDQFELSK